MILITGGEGSGKRTFAKTFGYEDKDIADGHIDDSPVICHVEEMIFNDPGCADLIFDQLAAKDIVIINETGSGVIPIERKERIAREATGRLACRLAKSADSVFRLISGIPQKIK